MTTHAASAYLDQPVDDRFETRLSKLLKRHAEVIAKAHGKTLSEYTRDILAEKVAADMASTQEWRLTVTEQAELIRVLSAPATTTPSLAAATRRAEELFGI